MRAIAFLGITVVGAAVIGLRLDSGMARDVGWIVVGTACTAAWGLGARWSGIADRWPWRLVVLGQALLTAGAVADLISRLAGFERSYPSAVDAFPVAGCLAVGLGLLLSLRMHEDARSRLVAIDSVLISGAAATAAWVLLLEPHVDTVRTAPTTAVTVAAMFAALVALGLAV